MAHTESSKNHTMHLGLFLLGGLSLGSGLMNLYWSFGHTDAGGAPVGLNNEFSSVGFSGLDNITLLGSADFSIPLVVLGIVCMVAANMTAWKQTDGY